MISHVQHKQVGIFTMKTHVMKMVLSFGNMAMLKFHNQDMIPKQATQGSISKKKWKANTAQRKPSITTNG